MKPGGGMMMDACFAVDYAAGMIGFEDTPETKAEWLACAEPEAI
jgi:hypothetical protein